MEKTERSCHERSVFVYREAGVEQSQSHAALGACLLVNGVEVALYNDKAPKEIAYALQISERIVQRYFNSISEKTGTQGRVGLTLLSSGFTIHED